jgi:hypothetical protein
MCVERGHQFACRPRIEVSSGAGWGDHLISARFGRCDPRSSETGGASVLEAPIDTRQETTIEIEVEGRWDALALSEALIPFHSFLVQLDQERWVVHARAPGCHGKPLSAALDAIDDWCAERHLGAASCRVDGRPHSLGAKERA